MAYRKKHSYRDHDSDPWRRRIMKEPEDIGTILDFHFSLNYKTRVIGWFNTGGPERHQKYTLNQLYSAIQDHFDEPDQMNQFVPLKALSLYEYRMDNGWTITAEAVRHLKLTMRPKFDWLLNEDRSHIEGRTGAVS